MNSTFTFVVEIGIVGQFRHHTTLNHSVRFPFFDILNTTTSTTTFLLAPSTFYLVDLPLLGGHSRSSFLFHRLFLLLRVFFADVVEQIRFFIDHVVVVVPLTIHSLQEENG